VLVPRPETEVVAGRCLELLAGLEEPAVLDVGTGSGAIALALADERPDASVVATDNSPAALELARENAEWLGLEVAFVETSLLDGVEGPFDAVVSNPPYVLAWELDAVQPEVRDWEPREATVAGGQTEALIAAAPRVLRAGGWLVLEAHEGRASDVGALLEASGYAGVAITRDLAGRERVVEGTWQAT
jgi:release factor glutamine methyltransferase